MLWIQSILQAMAVFLISPAVPPPNDGIWIGAPAWKQEGRVLVYTAESTKIVNDCRAHPEQSLVAPMLSQGGHEIFLDGKLVVSSADRTFRVASNSYNSASVPCKALIDGTKVRWEAFTQTHSLAILKRFPEVREPGFFGPFLRQTANVMITGTLIGLGILCFLIFYGKVEAQMLACYSLLCLSFALTFSLYVPQVLQFRIPQTVSQSISDAFMWIGLIFTGRLFLDLGYASKRMFNILLGCCLFAVAVIMVSGNLDQNQMGCNVAMFGVYIFLFSIFGNTKLLGHAQRANRQEILKVVGVLCFVLAGINDIIVTQFALDGVPVGPFGVLGIISVLALAVNDRIGETYAERDYLRANLEKEVERKTEDLKKKSTELEQALSTVKVAQAEVVQSAKLAALGTLSAGIAHEINNALNYVNGSLDPLTNMLKKEQLTDIDRGKIAKLLKLMKEGLDLTFGIIVNLKRHTSLSVDQNEVIPVDEVIQGVLLLLRNKLNGIQVKTEFQPSLRIQASRVSMSQIIINLVSNAADAIEEMSGGNGRPKEIAITSTKTSEGVEIKIVDSGPGIPKEIRERIFDPFFTTKAVGKGTGLGLHIVLTEVTKQGGRVEIESTPGQGATFILKFPDVAEGIAA